MLPLLLALAAAPDLTTTAERSQLTRTGRYEEVERFCRDYPAAYPGLVTCTSFGTTPEGRPMLVFAASRDGTLDPATARARARPVVLVQGGIHAGEIDGKDAGFMALRALLADKSALTTFTWVFVPVFNVDGHERFGPNHRPNQRGPAEMGWRTTAHNLNLNRDYTKADAPEMQAMLRLLDAWDPVLYVDLHVTDGAEFQHDIAVIVDPAEVGPDPLAAQGRALRDRCLEKLKARGSKPLPYYPSFEKHDDPSSGISIGPPPPRFGLGYWATRDRLSMLVETHSWKTYPTRVRATEALLMAVADQARARAAEWRRTADELDRRRVAGAPVVLTWDNGPRVSTTDFLGYAYSRTPSAISGQLRITYDAKKPQVWKMPMKDEIVPALTVTAPKAGYYLPVAATEVISRLAVHGFELRRLDAPVTATVEVFRASEAKFGAKPYEGRQTLRAQGSWKAESRTLPAGTVWVGLDQPGGRLLLHLLEPVAPDSFLAWGFFNGFFEQKEYMEDYVAEAWAEQLLARDAAVRSEFYARLANDPAFAADPQARLDFFYRRHPSWDSAHYAYPVVRSDTPPPGL